MSAAETRGLAEKLGDARNLVACARIAAADTKHLEGVYPVTTTLLVALDKIDDVLEALMDKAG